MATQTRQDKAVLAANNLIDFMMTLDQLRRDSANFIRQYTSEGYGATWSAMATAVQNPDGSLGSADPSPTAGHPIDTRLAGLTLLTKAATATQLTAGVTLLNQLASFFDNSAVITGNYSQNIDDLAN